VRNIVKAPWYLPRSWNRDTEQESTREWLRYAVCRIIGHRITDTETGVTYCSRCLDTMPEGFNRWQP
jgi:hypothetical protein